MFGLTPYSHKNAVSYYDPFREFENFGKAFFGQNDLMTFKTDIRETDSGFELEADLPGFKKEDIKIDVNGDRLTVSAERKDQHEEKDNKGNFIYRERSYGKYSRSFDMTDIETKNIKASYTDGVLKLELPKREKKEPESQHVEID